MISHVSPWLFASLSLVTYSFWGFFNGLTQNKIDPFSSLFYSSLGYFFAGMLALHYRHYHIQTSMAGVSIGVGIGLATGLGGLFLLLAMQKIQNTSLLIVLTSLYPLGTIVLCACLLQESLTLRESFGALLAIVGVIIMVTK